MKILIIDSFHHKNRIGLKLLLNNINYEYKFGNSNEINNYDIIYSPATPINSSQYPNKKFIFGPHFSVFPDNRLQSINNINNNSVYIQPSEWVCQLWKNYNVETNILIKAFPFPVEVEKFCPIQKSRNEVFIYFKRRKHEELEYVKQFLNNKNITYKIFDYVQKYSEEDYLKCLQNAKYGIIIDAHESQGFAIEEALSCNVPLVVWNVSIMSQEYGSNYSNIPCTSISYWDERCGEYFYKLEEFETTYNKFINKLETYSPREYIMENLSPQKCGQRFIELITSF
jgi:glycosyltransferase involved in cell wall biosynthesis